ncbi:sensor histidine kinase [Streptococcus oricebi]|uniref:histidine kinase n=1 Tax=Streptococcus oricebi TaxID=1547447 RepID=A0ABS5B1F2_9STRE|nr:sensor histidine kinase [Streptococcus oricebi]MBP2622659.1 sensor histidine kinase [Streptococcus oricebi]
MDRRDKIFFLKQHIYGIRYQLVLLLICDLLLFLLAALFDDYRSLLHYLLLIFLFFSVFMIWLDLAFSYQNFRREKLYESGRPQTALEALLFEKIEDLKAEKREQLALEKESKNDLLDYYTLWAHQIKTPIAASSLLVQDLKEADSKKQLEQEIFKIESYVNLVLQYLRLESFHDDLVLAEENLHDLVKEVVKKYALFFIQKGLRLNLHDLDRLVITDKKWFLVILEQVLSNSLKYTQEGEIEIYCQGDCLYLRDTGLGIRSSDLKRIFERGFSGYNGRLTQQSSGLGLYLSKQIADKLGHGLSLESQVGQGTKVCLNLSKQKLLLD